MFRNICLGDTSFRTTYGRLKLSQRQLDRYPSYVSVVLLRTKVRNLKTNRSFASRYVETGTVDAIPRTKIVRRMKRYIRQASDTPAAITEMQNDIGRSRRKIWI